MGLESPLKPISCFVSIKQSSAIDLVNMLFILSRISFVTVCVRVLPSEPVAVIGMAQLLICLRTQLAEVDYHTNSNQ